LALGGLLDIRAWTVEFSDSINGVVCQFGRDVSGVCYELLEPIGESSPVFPALQSGRAILNHTAYLVDDLAAAGERLHRHGCARTAEPRPAVAYGGCRIQFFVTPLRFVIELIEAPGHEHAYVVPG
jgi:methylmalonyl-CoA/ethylmalonyl-CoA epimerase